MSAPEETEPITITSPSGWKIDCPERTGVSTTKRSRALLRRQFDDRLRRAGLPAAERLSDLLECGPLVRRQRGDLFGVGRERRAGSEGAAIGEDRRQVVASPGGSTPVNPMMRTRRSDSCSTSSATLSRSRPSLDTSTTIALREKKAGECSRQASSRSNHPAIGASGSRARTGKDRPRKRM